VNAEAPNRFDRAFTESGEYKFVEAKGVNPDSLTRAQKLVDRFVQEKGATFEVVEVGGKPPGSVRVRSLAFSKGFTGTLKPGALQHVSGAVGGSRPATATNSMDVLTWRAYMNQNRTDVAAGSTAVRYTKPNTAPTYISQQDVAKVTPPQKPKPVGLKGMPRPLKPPTRMPPVEEVVGTRPEIRFNTEITSAKRAIVEGTARDFRIAAYQASAPVMKDATQVEKSLLRNSQHQIESQVVEIVSNTVEDATASNSRKTLLKEVVAKLAGAKLAMKASARAESLIPIIGWVPSIMDAREGIRDIAHGNITLGLMSIGVAAADIGSDGLHLGDVATGAGGTALSLTVQGWTTAMQIAIQDGRMKGRLRELNQYIDEKGELPPDLESYFGLNDEEIMILRNDLSNFKPKPKPPESVTVAAAAEERRKQQKLAAYQAGKLTTPPPKPTPQLLQQPSPLPTPTIDPKTPLGIFLTPPNADLEARQKNVADIFDAQQAQFIAIAKDLLVRSSANGLKDGELNHFRARRDVWIGQLRDAIRIAKERNWHVLLQRLNPIEDWVRTPGSPPNGRDAFVI
jgi:hypothetical protein